MLENTWCDKCQAADLGMTEPVEYENDGAVFVEGKCVRCASRVVSEVHERDAS
jgi:hypothetical protein